VNAEEQQWKWLGGRKRYYDKRVNMERQKIFKISKITKKVDKFFLCVHN
jgi:hypothetical protein